MARGNEKAQVKEAGREDTRVKEEKHKRRRPGQKGGLGKDEALGKKLSQNKEEVKFKNDIQGKEEAKGHCSSQN